MRDHRVGAGPDLQRLQALGAGQRVQPVRDAPDADRITVLPAIDLCVRRTGSFNARGVSASPNHANRPPLPAPDFRPGWRDAGGGRDPAARRTTARGRAPPTPGWSWRCRRSAAARSRRSGPATASPGAARPGGSAGSASANGCSPGRCSTRTGTWRRRAAGRARSCSRWRARGAVRGWCGSGTTCRTSPGTAATRRSAPGGGGR